jgi:hypothetical protein
VRGHVAPLGGCPDQKKTRQMLTDGNRRKTRSIMCFISGNMIHISKVLWLQVRTSRQFLLFGSVPVHRVLGKPFPGGGGGGVSNIYLCQCDRLRRAPGRRRLHGEARSTTPLSRWTSICGTDFPGHRISERQRQVRPRARSRALSPWTRWTLESQL